VLGASGCRSDDAPKPDPVRPPDQLTRAQGAELLGARKRLDEALRSVRTLRRSPAKARALHGKVREVASGGALESNKLDDFGEAALGDLGLAVPSLVERDADGVPKSFDREAVIAFLRHAESDPARALVIPARAEVAAIEETVEASDPGTETLVAPKATESPDLTVVEYLRGTQRALARTWPALEDRLRSVRERLASSSAS